MLPSIPVQCLSCKRLPSHSHLGFTSTGNYNCIFYLRFKRHTLDIAVLGAPPLNYLGALWGCLAKWVMGMACPPICGLHAASFALLFLVALHSCNLIPDNDAKAGIRRYWLPATNWGSWKGAAAVHRSWLLPETGSGEAGDCPAHSQEGSKVVVWLGRGKEKEESWMAAKLLSLSCQRRGMEWLQLHLQSLGVFKEPACCGRSGLSR